MLLVEIAEPGKEAAELRREAVRRGEPQAVRLLDGDRVLGRERGDEVARELVVDIGVQGELRFAEAEAAASGADVPTGSKARDREACGILGEIRVAPLQHD